MIKKSLPILIAAAILFLGYRIFVSQPQDKKKSIPYDTIICFGDSLTFGTGAVPGMDYPSQLSEMISKPVINAGVPGDTTASALTRLQRDVLSRFPDMVLITLGGNDLKNGVAKEVAFKNLKRIVKSIQGQGARVVIGGLKFPFRDRGFARGYKDLADQTGTVLIPDIFKDIIGNRSLMSDPIHPNGNGYNIMAQRFLEAMPSR
ncbi:MAG: arylesterase [Desulfobacterales bacterium]|jgi:lysophospholipase L1-like esterase